MKKAFALLILALVAWLPTLAQDEAPANDGFRTLEYEGYKMLIPQEAVVDERESEAVVKLPDATFGMSVKVEGDKKASASAAVEMCRRLARDLHVKGAQVARVMIHGMEGGRLEGITEGTPINVLILADKGKYLKLIILSAPEHLLYPSITIDSVSRG